MARGGARSGTPGKSYSNRTDMNQPIKVATGLPYGEHQALTQAQQAVPLPNAQSAATPPPAAPPAVGPGSPALPGQADFTRPTERPTEPVTAGISSGPGPGPEVLQSATQPAADLIGAQLQAVFAQFPNDDLLRVMALHQQGQ